MHLLVSWLGQSLALYVTSMLVPGFRISGIKGALVVGAVFGLLNFTLGWLLFVIIGISTFFIGFFFAFITWWIVSAILLMVADALTDRLSVDRFPTALVAAAVLALVSGAGRFLFR